MQFRKVNNITGWIVGIIACTVYLMTMEATGSFWDCGEFISSAMKVQIPHPPGAPLFILLGRICILFSQANPALGVNSLSALGSGFSILFLFWTITHFGRKLSGKPEEALTPPEIFTIMTAGAVGALAYTFSDSFWFSAVEGEVYGMSGFFTAIVFWTALKWENKADEPGSDKWIVLLFFLIGLSVGVHLLSLLAIPAVVMIYYFRRYRPSLKGGILAFLIGCALTGIVQTVVIQKTVYWASDLDIYFVNGLGLPFFSGFAFFYALLAAVIFLGIRWANRKNHGFLRLGLWCLTFLLVGCSMYVTTMERSNADPAIDMYNVDNPISLAGYLGRDQYGDFPLLYGQNFTAEPRYVNDGNLYAKGKTKYNVVGKKSHAEFDPEDQMLFPRLWDNSNDQQHADFYARWLGINKMKDPQTGRESYERSPTEWDNLSFFLTYQFNWMYLRYFFWNFAGKQNDIQGYGNPRDGNWITGIGPLDNLVYGDQSKMPDSIHILNKAYNRLFALPLILGILGFFFQFRRKRQDWLITGVFFFFTGIAIILYLNQPGNQPRERDYAYTGSFYAFAVWIGLGVFAVKAWLDRIKVLARPLSVRPGDTRHRNANGHPVSAGHLSLAHYLTAVVCLAAVPLLMACQEWDDHDRSAKTLPLSIATDYLESCAPDAILFTFGDNDTYPLWFAQEVMGVRPDIRVVNTSLLGIDWYINQLRYKINQSNPIDPIWGPDQVAGDKRNVIYSQNYVRGNARPETDYVDLETMMRQSGSDAPEFTAQTQEGEEFNTFSSHKVSIPVDTALVRSNGTVSPGDTVTSSVRFEFYQNYLAKNDAAMLGIIAANHWKRPIYFTSPYEALGFGQYLRQDGLAYRLVPVLNQPVNRDRMEDKLLHVFTFGNAQKPGVYFDEENRHHLLTIRTAYMTLAVSLSGAGRKEEARKVLEKCDKGMDPVNMPYGLCSRYGNDHDQISVKFAYAAYDAGDITLGDKVAASVRKDCRQQVNYYDALPSWYKIPGNDLEYEYRTAGQILREIDQMDSTFKRR
jgi:hypothetical protein